MTDTSSRLRQPLRYVLTVAAVAVAAVVVWTLGPGAGWVLRHVDGVHGLRGKELEDALDAVRGRALALGTGLAALVAVYYTARNADTARKTLAHSEESARRALQHNIESAARTAALTEQGQVTERYTKAIEQLNADSLGVRIGGVYALERIAADSVRDHPTVMEVLTAFIREHEAASDATSTFTPPDMSPTITGDVQAALTVIGRRTASQDTRAIDLSGSDLTGANLSSANLTRADLTDADLSGADLSSAGLSGAGLSGAGLSDAGLSDAGLSDAGLSSADLTRADLSDADLFRANLTEAVLFEADLFRADLARVDLSGANLFRVNLAETDLTSADLTRADLSDADLTGVTWSEATVWPDGYVDRARAASEEFEPGRFLVGADGLGGVPAP